MRLAIPPVLAGIVLAAAACGGGGGAEAIPAGAVVQGQESAAASASAKPAASGSPSESAMPAASGSASESVTPAPSGSASTKRAARSATTPTTCEDPAGDSSASLDLAEAGLVVGSEQVVTSFTWTGAVPATGSVVWIVTAASAGGDEWRRLGYEVVDGDESRHFVHDAGATESVHSDGVAVLEAQNLTASFPASAVEELGEDWTWTATIDVAGDDVDECEPA